MYTSKFGIKLVLVTFRLQYEDDYMYEFSVLSTRFRFGGRKFVVFHVLQSEGRYWDCGDGKKV